MIVNAGNTGSEGLKPLYQRVYFGARFCFHISVIELEHTLPGRLGTLQESCRGLHVGCKLFNIILYDTSPNYQVDEELELSI